VRVVADGGSSHRPWVESDDVAPPAVKPGISAWISVLASDLAR